jgi:hypothetical protein
VTDFQIRHSVSALRARKGDVADSSPAPTPAPATGEPLLTLGQKIALLTMRKSDWAIAVLAKLREAGAGFAVGADFRSLIPLHLAINKGSFHNLTAAGRWRAYQVAMQIARELGIHVLTYDWTGAGRPCFVRCTCGFSVHRQQRNKHLLGRSGANHLAFVASQITTKEAVA